MPLAIQVMKSMRTRLVFLVVLLIMGPFAFPVAKAAPPMALQRFPSVGTSSVEPGGNMTFSWALTKDLSEFLLYYDVAGGAGSSDTIDVYVNYVAVPRAQFLVGRGWIFCDGCQLNAGTYEVAVLASPENTGPLQFYIAVYALPEPPVDFAGFIPANSTQPFSEFGVLFPPSSTNYTLVLGVTGASYDFFINYTLMANVTETTTLSLDLGGRFQRFTVEAWGASADVTWTVQIQGQPKLEVEIVNPQSSGCNATLNPQSGQSFCVVGAVATPSDGGSPTITYLWTASGGELNSTSSQWVQWTAPAGAANFTLTVEASAPGYASGSDNLKVQVVPEFQAFVTPLLLALVLALTAIAQRRSRKETPHRSRNSPSSSNY
jgi:hypothetical protein